MKTAKKIMDRIIEAITVTLFLVMVVAASWQVLTRYVLKDPSTVTEEFLRFSVIWLAMLAAAYIVGKNSHISITLLSDKLQGHSKLIIDIIVQISFLLFATIVMIYGGWKTSSITMMQVSPALKIPMGLIYLSLPVSGVFATIYSIFNIIELFTKNKTNDLNEKEA